MRAKPLPPEERRAAIIAAARPLLSAQGPQVSTREIAEAAGIAEGTLFRVFATKDELVEAVVHDTLDPTPTCARIRAVPATLPLDDRVDLVLEILRRRTSEITGLFIAMRLAPPKERTPEREREEHDRHARHTAMINDALLAVLGDDAHAMRVPPTTVATYLSSLAFITGHPMLSKDFAVSTTTLTQVVLHGLIAEPTDPTVARDRSTDTTEPFALTETTRKR